MSLIVIYLLLYIVININYVVESILGVPLSQSD